MTGFNQLKRMIQIGSFYRLLKGSDHRRSILQHVRIFQLRSHLLHATLPRLVSITDRSDPVLDGCRNVANRWGALILNGWQLLYFGFRQIRFGDLVNPPWPIGNIIASGIYDPQSLNGFYRLKPSDYRLTKAS